MSTAKRVRRRIFTDTSVAHLQRRPKRYIRSDPEQRGHYVRVMPRGPHVFVAVARNQFGSQIWFTVGTTAELKIDEAREKARHAIRRIKAGLPPVEPPKLAPDSVALVCKAWLERVVIKNGYRTAAEKARIVERYITPHFKGRAFVDIRRSDITALLDHVEDKHGPHMADAVLTVLRTVATWVAKRDDGFTPPFVKGMNRVSDKARKRSRILDDDELRRVWRAADDAGAFGDLVKLLLLTTQRRGAVIHLKWDDVDLQAGTWNVPQEERAKGTGGTLRLPKMALDIIRRQPRLVGSNDVFFTQHNIDRAKARLDQASGVNDFTLHDLRRTARSLMSRALVPPHVAERVLGHVIGGVEGVYDRHRYDAEKADALQRLADLIGIIIDGASDSTNVTPLREAAVVS